MVQDVQPVPPTITAQPAPMQPSLLEVEYAPTVPTLVPPVMVLVPALLVSVVSTSSKVLAKLPVLLELTQSTECANVCQELSLIVSVLQVVDQVLLQLAGHANLVTQTVPNVQETSTNAQLAFLVSLLMQAQLDASQALNVLMVKRSVTVFAPLFAITVSTSTKEFVSMEAVSVDMQAIPLEAV